MSVTRAAAWGDARSLATRLRHRVSIEQAIDTADDAGGSSRSWSNLATVWAEITPLRNDREQLFAQQLEARTTHRITMRYRGDVKPHHRVAWDGRYFNIRSVVNVGEANVILEILADEGVAL